MSEQVIVENGRVSATFKAILSILCALATAAIIGVFVTISQLKDSIGQLTTAVTVLNINYGTSKDERTKLEQRISSLERQRWACHRDNNRDQ